MPFQMIRNDITRMQVDAIVNAANRTLLGGGGVDGAIHAAAGPRLLEECRTLGGCETGEAKITGGYNLPAKYVIHTVGPIWDGGQYGEKELLQSCYRSALNLAKEYGCESIAFPLISAGVYGYPKADAMAVAVGEITDFLRDNEMMVYLVVFGRSEYLAGKQLFRDVQEFIDDVYAEEHIDFRIEQSREAAWRRSEREALDLERELSAGHRPPAFHGMPEAMPDAAPEPKKKEKPEGGLFRRRRKEPKAGIQSGAWAPLAEETMEDSAPDWQRILRQTDEGFSPALMRLIDEKKMTDTECYKRANVDRKLFSKIRSNPDYRPSKPTVFAFAVALRLDMDETDELLRRAGFARTRSSRMDLVMEYFISHRIYNIYDINEVLFQYDLPLLGSGMN